MSVILHIGSQRTGSTYLQREVFGNIDFVKHGHVCFSDENIWSNIWDKHDDRWERLGNLIKNFPHAFIVFGTRDRKGLLKSLYKKYVTMGGTLQYWDFDTVINTDKVDHELYIEELHKAYDNVYIYNHNSLLKHPDSVICGLCKFMGVPIPVHTYRRYNVGYGPIMLPLARQLNKLYKNDFNTHGFIPCHYYRIPHRFLYQEVIKR